MSNKVIKICDLHLQDNMDADDEGQRIVEAIRKLNPDAKIFNILTVNFNKYVPYDAMKFHIEQLDESIRRNGISNYHIVVTRGDEVHLGVEYLFGDNNNETNNRTSQTAN